MYLMLFLLWMCLNARASWDVIVCGIAVALLVGGVCRRFPGYTGKINWLIFKQCGRFIRYLLLLIWEMVLANIEVIKLVLSPKMEIKPCLIFTRPHIRSVIGRVLFANSITLTPGTITAGLTKQGCWIHALTIEMAEKTKESALALQIREMEGEEE